MVNFSSNIGTIVQNTTVAFPQNVEEAFLSYHGHDDGTKAEIVKTEASRNIPEIFNAVVVRDLKLHQMVK
jgi:hypothetical protein